MANPFNETAIAHNEHNALADLEQWRSLFCAGLLEISFIFNKRDEEFFRKREFCGDPGELETYFDKTALKLTRHQTAQVLLNYVREEFKPFVRFMANRPVGKLPRVVFEEEVKDIARAS